MAATKSKKRSKEENELELRRLQQMYSKLPPDKQAVHRDHMQARINKLIKAINDDGKSKSSGGGVLQTIMLIVLACVVALGAGFFGVTYMAQ